MDLKQSRTGREDATYPSRPERGLLLVLASLLCSAASGCAHGPQGIAMGSRGRITKGPCLLRLYQDRAALMWETDTESPWSVYYGRKGKLDTDIESAAEKVVPGGPTDGGPKTVYIHKVWIEGLKPGQAYHYRIVGSGVRSDAYEFRTVPLETDEVRFIVYGDSRTQVDVHRRLVEQMMKHDVAFIVNGGDLVSRGDEYRQWGPQFFEPLKGLMERVPIYIAKGNHEGQNGTYERLLVPPGEENDFTIDYGPLHYFCADNVSRRLDDDRIIPQITRAAADGARWKFVSYHVPSVNFGGHWSDWRQREALSAFADAGIDFVVAGHSHQYERFRPIEPAGKGQHVTYITAGGGGAPLYDVEPTIYHACAKTAYHFCVFHIKGDTLVMDTIDIDGRIIDHLEVTKSEGRLNKQYLWTAVPVGGIQLHQRLHENLDVVLSEVPEKDRPFTVNIRMTLPPLSNEARLTFELRGDPDAYRLPEPCRVTVPEAGGPVRAELTVTPRVAVDPPTGRPGRASPLSPTLRLDCRYELGRIDEIVSHPVAIRGR